MIIEKRRAVGQSEGVRAKPPQSCGKSDLWRSETGTVLGRLDERLDHLRIDPVAKEVQLPELEVVTASIRIAFEITEVFHLHKRRIEQAVVEGLAVRRVEDQHTARNCLRSVYYLKQHAGACFSARIQSVYECLPVRSCRRYTSRLEQLVDVMRVVQVVVNRPELSARDKLIHESLLVSVNYIRGKRVVHDDSLSDRHGIARELIVAASRSAKKRHPAQ